MSTQFVSNLALINLLKSANPQELLSLTKLLDQSQTVSWTAEKIQKEISETGGHSFTNVFRGEGTSYLDILDDIVDTLEIKGLPSYFSSTKGWPALRDIDKVSELKFKADDAVNIGMKYMEVAEEKVLLKILEKNYEKMRQEERTKFEQKINEVALQYGADPTNKLAGTAGIIALGNLGGFATYTFLTTAMSAISMGTLGFGAYTAATSALSVALGPVGWLGLGAAAVYSYGKPKYNKLIPIVATIGLIRQRIKYEKLQAEKLARELAEKRAREREERLAREKAAKLSRQNKVVKRDVEDDEIPYGFLFKALIFAAGILYLLASAL